MAYSSQSLLEYAVGGAAVLKELLDKDGDGTADSALVTDVLARADAEVNSAIQVAVQLPLVTTPDAVKYAATDVAAFVAFQYGTAAQGVPDQIRSRYEAALRWLDDVATRKRTVGTASRPTTDQQVEQVKVEPYTAGTSIRDSLRGFW